MSEVIGEGVIRIRTDESGVDTSGAGSRAGQGYTKGFLGSLKGLVVGIGAVLAARGAVNFLKDSVAEAREAQKVAATTEQIIKATGGAANVTSSDMERLTGALSKKIGVDDELIQSGANLLLTFKNVRNEAGKGNDIFNRATKSAADLAAAGFGSIESGSKGLGKALNDPLKGISALSRAGVTFTEQQKEQIKSMVESGDILSAQKIILGEVESQVGGVAEAQATGAQKASVAWGNLKEDIGAGLLPIIDRLATLFADNVIPALYQGVDAAKQLGPVFGMVGDYIKQAFASDGAGALFDQFKATIATVIPTVQMLAGVFVSQVLPVLQQLAGVFLTQVLPVIAQVYQFVYGQLIPIVVQLALEVAGKLRPVFDQLVETFVADVIPTVRDLVTNLQPIIVRVFEVIGTLVRFAATILSVVLPPLIRLAGFIIRNVVPVIVTIIDVVVRVIATLVRWGGAIGTAIGKLGGFASALVGLVQNGLDKVISAVTFLPRKIIELGPKLLEAGKSIIGKFLEGLKGVGSFASGIADAVWGAVKGVINSAIDKLNSLLEFTIDVGPKSFTVNPPNIGHLATGRASTREGTFLVGERGAELVSLPRGSRVDNAAATRSELAQTGPQKVAELHVHMPTGDPEAAALAAMDRLALVGFTS